MQGHNGPFESLPMPRKETAAAVSRYRVYDNADHFVVVTAGTALEALKASGLKDSHKIQRDLLADANVLEADFWEKEAALETKEKEQNAVGGSTPPPAEPAAGGDPAAATPAAEAAATGDPPAATPAAAEPPAS